MKELDFNYFFKYRLQDTKLFKQRYFAKDMGNDKELIERLPAMIKEVADDVEKPSNTNFALDSLYTIAHKNFRQYLGLSLEMGIPVREVKEVTENYLRICNEWVRREGEQKQEDYLFRKDP